MQQFSWCSTFTELQSLGQLTVLNTLWKTIAEFPNYEVSNTGLVRRIGNDDPMSFFIQNQGYAVASLAVQAKSSKKRTIHRLVALAFLPNDAGKTQVNHKDGNKLNNHVSNLEWVSPQENAQHAMATGLTVYNKPTTGKKLPQRGKGKPTPYFGICWVEKSQFWVVRVQHNCKVVIQKAGFKDELSAARYYDEHVLALGLNRPLNFPQG